MIEAVNWRDVKAKARAIDPTWDSNDRVDQRQQMREQMLAVPIPLPTEEQELGDRHTSAGVRDRGRGGCA